MAQNHSKTNCYPSKYSPGNFVTPSQFVVETICEVKARAEGKDLPIHFWELEEWRKFFRQQIPTANQLVKKYSAQAIVRVLKASRNKNTWSLRAPWLEEQFATEQKQLEKENMQAGEELIQTLVENPVVGRPTKKGVLDKLDDNN